MRIGTISQYHPLQRVTLGRRCVLFSKVATDRVVVFGGHLECLERKTVFQRLAHVALAPRLQKRVVIRRVGQHTHPLMVLGRRSEKGDTPDIDLLDGFCEGTARLRDGGRKRIEIADDDGDLGDGLVCQVMLVGRDRTRENTLQCNSVPQTEHGSQK